MLVLEALVVLSVWGPQPVAWMWVGSQLDYLTGSVFLGIACAFFGLIGTLILTLMLATRLDGLWKLLRRAAGPRPARRRARADLRRDRDRRGRRLHGVVPAARGPRVLARAALMGFRDYYRQFEEMAPEEISAELLARRDERRRKAVTKLDPLDLSGTTWHEPPHPDAVNAATFALRRAVNEPPDLAATALREALAARHGVAVEQVAAGHGAGELLRALLGRVVGGVARR